MKDVLHWLADQGVVPLAVGYLWGRIAGWARAKEPKRGSGQALIPGVVPPTQPAPPTAPPREPRGH